MTERTTPNEDVIFERAVQVLRAGFAVSALFLIAGIIWSLVERRAFDARVLPFRDLPHAVRTGDPTAIVDIGILAMMLTPVVLVLAIAWEFHRLRERHFAIASVLVLGVLLISIAISLFR